MQVSELRDALSVFNQAMPVEVSVPETGKPPESRALRIVGHIDHPGEAKTDHTVHALDLECDPWTGAVEADAKVETVADLLAELTKFPDPMHVRIAMPISHSDISHRMLDIVMVGRVVGSAAGAAVQLVTESWDYPSWVIKEISEKAAARTAEYERLATSVPPGEAVPQ